MTASITVLFASFAVMIFVGVPVGVSLGLSAILAAAVAGIPIMAMVHNIATGLDSFTLLAVPMFILVASLMNTHGVTQMLVDFATKILGRVRGGLAYVNVIVSMIFAGISGSAVADTAGVGKVLIDGMTKSGYKRDFTIAITAISSTIGSIIPPSIFMVIYGAFTEVSIAALFLGGAIPGLVIGLSQIGYILWTDKREKLPGGVSFTFKEKGWATVRALPCFPIPFILIGGIVGGWFTATEAATVAVLYILFINMFIYRNLTFARVYAALKESVLLVGPILFAVANSIAFGWVLAYHQFPQMVGHWAVALEMTPLTVLFFVHVLFLILGTFLGGLESIIIFAPILMALAAATGVDPVLMGVVVCMTLAIGLVTPPYGLCLLVACRIGDLPVGEGFRRILGLLALEICVVILGILWPPLILTIPRLLLPGYT